MKKMEWKMEQNEGNNNPLLSLLVDSLRATGRNTDNLCQFHNVPKIHGVTICIFQEAKP